jgi:hypothetical protein
MSISRYDGDNFRIAHADAARLDARVPLASRIEAVPPHAYFVGSAIFHYLGPSFAVLLFARVDVLGVAWLRITGAADLKRWPVLVPLDSSPHAIRWLRSPTTAATRARGVTWEVQSPPSRRSSEPGAALCQATGRGSRGECLSLEPSARTT